MPSLRSSLLDFVTRELHMRKCCPFSVAFSANPPQSNFLTEKEKKRSISLLLYNEYVFPIVTVLNGRLSR